MERKQLCKIDNLTALREIAFLLYDQVHQNTNITIAEETFVKRKMASDSGNKKSEQKWARIAEKEYRKAILTSLCRSCDLVKKDLPSALEQDYRKTRQILAEAENNKISIQKFIECTGTVRAFINLALHSVPRPFSHGNGIRYVSETFIDKIEKRWKFGKGVSLVSVGNEKIIAIVGDSYAEWKDQIVHDGRIDFRYRHGSGTGIIQFRSSAINERKGAYILSLEDNRLVLRQKNPQRTRQVGDAPLSLIREDWYDVSIWLAGSIIVIAVDGRPILHVRDDAPWLEPGYIIFAGEDASGIAFSNIRLTATPRGMLKFPDQDTLLLSSPLKQLFLKSDLKNKKIHPKLSQLYIPFEVKPYLGPKHPTPINAGDVPPNYHHTWAFDLLGLDSFSLAYNGIHLQWESGDSLSLYDYSLLNPLIATYTSDLDLTSTIVKVQQLKGGEYKRLYLCLRTGPEGTVRSFQVSGLHVPKAGVNLEALLIGDDLNYDQNGPLLDPDKVAGHEKIYAPWKPYSPGVIIGVSIPPPRAEDGWFLLANNTTQRETGVFTLLFYNERTSCLRAYLYNTSLSSDATFYRVTFSLAGRAPGIGFIPLKGAFFNADPRPQKWSSASFTIPIWPKKTWAFAETNLLYPMAEDLPGAKSPLGSTFPESYYRPLYEEEYEQGLNNCRLVITIQGFQLGELKGDLVGQAIGEAVQKTISSDITGFNLLKGAASAIITGKDYYDKGTNFHKSLQDFLNNKFKDGTPQSELQGLQALVGFGASAFGGFLGIVGLGIGIYQSFFAKSEPLRLSMEMVIRGSIAGSVFTPLMPANQSFFLPGRWSVQEAFQGNYPVNDPNRIDAELSRYDRILGHFGFRYDPGKIEFRLLQVYYCYGDDKPDDLIPDPVKTSRYIFPSIDHVIRSDPPTPNISLNIPSWLPVIYNPFAEIIPLRPMPVATATDNGIIINKEYADEKADMSNPNPWFDWRQDISPASHIIPEPGDNKFPRTLTEFGVGSRAMIKVFPMVPKALFPDGWLVKDLPNGIWLSIPPDTGPSVTTCRDFISLNDIPVHTWWDLYVDDDFMYGPDLPNPLRDIIFYWDVAYFHYPRTRKSINGDVPLYRGSANLLSPVSIDHLHTGFNYSDDHGVWFPWVDKQKSQLLLEKNL